MTSAAEWFRRFKEEFPNDDAVLMLEKEFLKRETRDSSRQWTAIVSVFLMKLAHRMGYLQEWEWGSDRIDFAWYRENRDYPPLLIEHENEYRNAVSRELPKLLQPKYDKCELKILITYTWVHTDKPVPSEKFAEVRRKIQDEVRGKIGSRRLNGDLLLIIGNEPAPGDNWNEYWHGYVLDREAMKWISLSSD